MTDRSRIDAELDGARLSPDGSRLILLLRDTAARLTPTRATLRAMTPVLGWTVPGAPAPR